MASIYLVPDLLEEIFLGLPLESILKFKTVSKLWRSILESSRFLERRMKLQKKLKIMAAGDRIGPRFEGDEEVKMVYLHCDVASRPSLSCDGLVCIPVPGWVNVLNPSTREFLRFPSGPDPDPKRRTNRSDFIDSWFDVFPGYWTMGFGREKVNGSYKIVRMYFKKPNRCEILDVNIGVWRKLSPPPYSMNDRRKSACVNGCIYWLQLCPNYKILALDLHTEEFRDVLFPITLSPGWSGQIVNLEDRLALAATYVRNCYWNVEIWSMDAQEETWSVTYSICLFHIDMNHQHLPPLHLWYWTRPVAISNRGNLFFHDNGRRLFKYYPETGEVRRIESDICVISPFVENLLPLPRSKIRAYGFQCLDHAKSSWISNFFGRIQISNILLTTVAVTFVTFFL